MRLPHQRSILLLVAPKLRYCQKKKFLHTQNSYVTQESWNVFLEWVCLLSSVYAEKDKPPQPFIHMLPFSVTGMQMSGTLGLSL